MDEEKIRRAAFKVISSMEIEKLDMGEIMNTLVIAMCATIESNTGLPMDFVGLSDAIMDYTKIKSLGYLNKSSMAQC